MKTLYITIIAFTLGAALTYVISNTLNATTDQRLLESQITLELEVLKLANEGKHEQIQALLKAVNACHATEYKAGLEGFFWQESDTSADLLARSEQNRLDNQGCDTWTGVKQ